MARSITNIYARGDDADAIVLSADNCPLAALHGVTLWCYNGKSAGELDALKMDGFEGIREDTPTDEAEAKARKTRTLTYVLKPEGLTVRGVRAWLCKWTMPREKTDGASLKDRPSATAVDQPYRPDIRQLEQLDSRVFDAVKSVVDAHVREVMSDDEDAVDPTPASSGPTSTVGVAATPTLDLASL